MGKIQCPHCGKENSIDANFCAWCSAKLVTTCQCWVLKRPYNCGKKKCPGNELILELLKAKEQIQSLAVTDEQEEGKKFGMDKQDSEEMRNIFDRTFYRAISGFMIYSRIVVQKFPDGMAEQRKLDSNEIKELDCASIIAEQINEYLRSSNPVK